MVDAAEVSAYQVDKRRVRLAFDRAAAHYDEYAKVQGMVREELLARLAGIRVDAKSVVDVGCGTGVAVKALRQHFPQAQVLGLDFSQGMLQQARHWRPWLRKPLWVCGDMERLPLRDASVDVLFASLSVQWGTDLAAMFAEARRVLRKDGVFLFATLGPDSLKELRAAWQLAEGDGAGVNKGTAHVNLFYDMHDVGDALLRAGLGDPVMDVERLRLEYADVEAVMRSLKGIGAQNHMQGRARGLTRKSVFKAMRQAYEAYRLPEGVLPLTYEVVYGLAWGAEAGRFSANAAGEVKIPLRALLGRGAA